MQRPVDAGGAATVACRNCGTGVAGRYCPECGQDREIDPRSVGRWLAEVGDDLFALSGRLPRTVRALLVPGRLTRDWLDGRHARYVHPFRLFLLCGLALFAFPRLSPGEPYAGVELAEVTLDRIASTVWSEEIDRRVTEVGPTVMIVLMPLFALSLKVAFGGSGRLYAEHLVFALNLHSVAFLLFVPTVVLAAWEDRVPDWIEDPLLLAAVAAILVHLYGGLRRVYGSSALRAMLLAPLLVSVQALAIALGLLAGADVALDDPRDAAVAADRLYRRVGDARAAKDTGQVRELLPRAIASHARIELHVLDAHRRFHLADLLMQAARIAPDIASNMAASADGAARECLVSEPERPLCLGIAAEAAGTLGRSGDASAMWSRFREADPGVDDPWGHHELLEGYRRAAAAAARSAAPGGAASEVRRSNADRALDSR